MDKHLLVAPIILLVAMGGAIWNAFIKRAGDRLVFAGLMVVPQFLLALPIAVTHIPLSSIAWELLLLSACVHTGYIIFLGFAYKRGELSSVFPIAIGTAPLLTLLYGWLFAGHQLNWVDVLGVMIVSLGVILLPFTDQFTRKREHRQAIRYALITAVFISIYAVIDERGIKTTPSPEEYISWLFTIKALLLFIPLLFFGRINRRAVIGEWPNFLIAGLLAGLGYAAAVWAFSHAESEVVLAFRTTSIVFSLLIAAVVLKERVTWQKGVLGLVITSGVFLILVG